MWGPTPRTRSTVSTRARSPNGSTGSRTVPQAPEPDLIRAGPRRTFLPAGFTVTGTTSTYRNQRSTYRL